MDLIDKLIRDFCNLKASEHQPSPCPDEDTIAAFAEGKLEKPDIQRIKEHLISCDNCLELAKSLAKQMEEQDIESSVNVPLRSLGRVMRLDPAREGAWDIVVDFARGMVNAFKSSGEASFAEPVAAGAFRGVQKVISENLVVLQKEFPPFHAEIEVEKINNNRGEITIQVNEKETRKPAKGVRVSLYDPERELESYLLDKGHAVFENLKFGKYSIRLTKKGEIIGKISLDMKK